MEIFRLSHIQQSLPPDEWAGIYDVLRGERIHVQCVSARFSTELGTTFKNIDASIMLENKAALHLFEREFPDKQLFRNGVIDIVLYFIHQSRVQEVGIANSILLLSAGTNIGVGKVAGVGQKVSSACS